MNEASSASVVICAYTQRRWDELNAAIDSALAQPETSEVIVVIDHEDLLLQRLRDHRRDVTALPNSMQQGLSGARNVGLAAATRPIVAFLDDDAQAEEGWLAELLAPFSDETVVGVGGRADPIWPGEGAPVMLPVELLWVVGCTFRGQPTTLAPIRNVMGCSMAFSRDALTAVGGFNLDTGRIGTIPLGNEETEVCIRITQADSTRRILFQPASRIRHHVTPDRVTWRYLRRRSFFEGVSKAAVSRSLGAGDALSSERSYTTSILPSGVLREIRAGRPLGAFAILLSLGSAGFGFAYGLLRGAKVSRAEAAPLVVSNGRRAA